MGSGGILRPGLCRCSRDRCRVRCLADCRWPGLSEAAVVMLRVLDGGTASLQVAVTVEAQQVERSVLECVVSERVSVTVSG